MRKEVRIGAIIGGILVIALIVIAVVSTNGHKPAAVVLDKPPAGTALGGVVVSPTPAGPATPGHDDVAPTPPHDATTDTTGTTPGAAPGVTPGDAGSTPTPGASPPTPAAGGDQTPTPAAPEATAGKSSANWTHLLSEEKVEADYEPIHTSTPELAAPSDPAPTPGADPSTPVDVSAADPHATPTQVADTSTGTDGAKGGSGATPSDAPPAAGEKPAPPPSAGATTHKIASGETFSSISRAVYGDAKYFKEIVKANPTVDPNHLKLGTVITLPDPAQFKHDAKPAEKAATPPAKHPAPAAPAAVNPKTEYRVQSTDSLYKISIKLYKTPNKVDAIYQLNKEAIGTDPAKLKLNMVLKLPEPPVETASR